MPKPLIKKGFPGFAPIHGKEGVIGSNPISGSKIKSSKTLKVFSGFFHLRGDMALCICCDT